MSFLSLNGNPVHVPTYDDAYNAVAAEVQRMGGLEADDLCWTEDPEFLPSNGGWRVRAWLWMPDPHHPHRDPYGERTFVLTHEGDGRWKAANADRGYLPWCRDVREWGLERTLEMDAYYLWPMNSEVFNRAEAAVRCAQGGEAPDPYEMYEAERWPRRVRISRR